jgi:hypothetical protein
MLYHTPLWSHDPGIAKPQGWVLRPSASMEGRAIRSRTGLARTVPRAAGSVSQYPAAGCPGIGLERFEVEQR